ncbi:hypothetical protein [Pantoea eucrina]|uniref:hypothetical protein n=3 Tax=Pantoea TaxID=53335 RepID=UPI0024B698F8|nr:hypothetical protein [Pantoea eucrina]MDJ0023030.1 hypothetical protein [Pantoea eucrina]
MWSRIIGILRSESTLFKIKMFVRFKNSHPEGVLANVLVLLAEKAVCAAAAVVRVIEESSPPARMCALFFRVNPFFCHPDKKTCASKAMLNEN